MRLLKLKIKNIASLKGEHTISFRDIEAQSPLFAITGETGAGKSTILNSIGLALYGKVYKSNVTQQDLVTLGEKEGQIELVFQVKGKNYLAFWRGRVRKQNGELYSSLQTPQREIYALTGEELGSPKSIITTKAEDILNLDFDQFCKCIILNQGEFSRFLASSFSDRKDILEKLYPGEVLDRLSGELRSEKDSLEKQKSSLEIELSTLRGDGPAVEDLFTEKIRLHETLKLHEEWLTHVESFHFHFLSLQSYHQKHSETKRKLSVIKEDLSKGTSTYNHCLSDTKKIEQSFREARKNEDQKLPRLKELLKLEENLKSQTEQTAQAEQKETRLKEALHALLKKQENLETSLVSWEKKLQEQKNQFNFPIAKLLEHRLNVGAIIESYSEKNLLVQDLSSKELRLKEVEIEGKDKAAQQIDIQNKLKLWPLDLNQKLEALERQKKQLQLELEKKQRAEIQVQELSGQVLKLNTELKALDTKLQITKTTMKASEDELHPIETTLKLQSLLSAIEVCRTHPSITDECPVCETRLESDKWAALRLKVGQTDLSSLKIRETELSRKLMKAEEEANQIIARTQGLSEELVIKSSELNKQSELTLVHLPQLSEVEAQISILQKQIWEKESLQKDETKLSQDLKRARDQYTELKHDKAVKEKLLERVQASLEVQVAPLKEVLPNLDESTLEKLKHDARLLGSFIDFQNKGEKIKVDVEHLKENIVRSEFERTELKAIVTDGKQTITQLKTILSNELQDQSASTMISLLRQVVKESGEELEKKERELKREAESLKLLQGQIYTHDELLRDMDMQFSKELHQLREAANVPLPHLKTEITGIMAMLKTLGLELSSPSELFVPLRDSIETEKELLKKVVSELKMELARVMERIDSWEKRQDRILLLELKLKDLVAQLDRKQRLYEVLGKDELRTFVLALVEENLILQTNDELQKLCQGRYEIIHQSGRARLPEFYILDKFREGELRKVSTLSGGETFMVSLAMALGLAEMTRGQTEIDSLFIDEGFGTLDQDSLEDVVDMLKQIQTRGLMVGVISHIKALTNSLPVNLQVSKKQDGTSNISVVHN